jgi:hypothetical protein
MQSFGRLAEVLLVHKGRGPARGLGGGYLRSGKLWEVVLKGR